MDDGRASDGGFTETDDNNSIMTPASDGTETPKTANIAANATTTVAASAAPTTSTQTASSESQLQDLFTITNNLREQLATQTQANEQLKAELAATRAELASSVTVQQGFSQTLNSQQLAVEAHGNHVITLKELIAPTGSYVQQFQRDAAPSAADASARSPSQAESVPQRDLEAVHSRITMVTAYALKNGLIMPGIAELFGVMGSMIHAAHGDPTALERFETAKLSKINSYVEIYESIMGSSVTDDMRNDMREKAGKHLELSTKNVAWFVRNLKAAFGHDSETASLRADLVALDTQLKDHLARYQEKMSTHSHDKHEAPTKGLDTPLSSGSDSTYLASVDASRQDICPHCNSVIAHLSIGPCNHAVCHICVLRGRVMYRSNACPTCKADMSTVVFTDEAEKKYESYGWEHFFRSDPGLGINYEKEEIFLDTVLLLRYNCPDESCDVACMGWPDLHRHVRTVHHRVMCDLCTRNKRVFTHEHELFTQQDLRQHEKDGDGSDFHGHPECGLCMMRFFGVDELEAHVLKKHEQCMVCEGNVAVFLSKADLDKHMESEHNTFTIPVMQQETLQKTHFPGAGVSLSYPVGIKPNQSLRMHVYDDDFLMQFRGVCNSQPSEDLCRRVMDIRQELADGSGLPAVRAKREIRADKHSRVKGTNLADSIEKQKAKALCQNGFRGV
ncbi:hypothetical protein LTR15_011376 [Elasticomyces elasticus]|nr:hypothetical protein LTR15_011376 [Elasticomyces elasticus]